MAREGVALNVIQRQLGHANVGIMSVCLHGIDNSGITETVHSRAAPMLPASAGLPLTLLAQWSSGRVARRRAGRRRCVTARSACVR
jgi:hypothetical protein